MDQNEITILGIGAHAADVFGRAGGTIARYVQMGHKASVVALAYGERGEAQDAWGEKERAGNGLHNALQSVGKYP